MEVLLQNIQQLQNQVFELTQNQQRDQRSERADKDAEGSRHQHHQATHTPVSPPFTSIYSLSHPFSEFIIIVPLLDGFHLLGTLEPYNDTTDP